VDRAWKLEYRRDARIPDERRDDVKAAQGRHTRMHSHTYWGVYRWE
jgi:hypothetical protein